MTGKQITALPLDPFLYTPAPTADAAPRCSEGITHLTLTSKLQLPRHEAHQAAHDAGAWITAAHRAQPGCGSLPSCSTESFPHPQPFAVSWGGLKDPELMWLHALLCTDIELRCDFHQPCCIWESLKSVGCGMQDESEKGDIGCASCQSSYQCYG